MFRSSLALIGWCTLLARTPVRAQDKKAEGDLDKVVKLLRHKEVRVRIKAAEDLGKLGPDAAPAAKALCDALLDLSPRVNTAALEAIEKARPDLYKLLATLLLDNDPSKQLQAVKELGLLGEKANPTVNVLLTRLRRELATRGTRRLLSVSLGEFEDELFTAIRQIKPDDLETIKLYKVMAGSSNQDSYARVKAIVFLADWAGEDAGRRKELLPFLRAGLANGICQLTCIELAGAYGPLAKDFVPLLKKLKLSTEEIVREAASAALDKIENP